MQGPRYFAASDIVAGVPVELNPDDARHASTVLRCRVGEALILIAEGVAWDAEFASVDGHRVSVVARQPSVLQSGELPAKVTILQALTKGAKFDEVVEKTVELGAVRIVPVIFSRSETAGSANKVERWRRIARAAAMQSRRRVIPSVDEPITWSHACSSFPASSLTLLADENADRAMLGPALERYIAGTPIVIAVGPEGGLTTEDVERATVRGATPVSLGPTILRTETAAAALLAAVASGLGWW
ncbi:MAG TPA: 16S rRNA (uracil(1498)-N(3))-methyltransferase [Candidatus Eremiobacteraceae bacterium]|nr:16S rRNA (uracil(1498)-N(3))-methyltransferase [Candidatus Eremiobacteraceae bacterium]